jgi:hypothetical protein
MEARQGFASDLTESLRGKSLAVDGSTGVVQAGTRLWSDHPIVLDSPWEFLDASELPGPAEIVGPVPANSAVDPWGNAEWLEIVRAYRALSISRPSQLNVAEKMGLSEASVRIRLRQLGIASWRAVHAMIAADPGSPTK